MLLGVISRAKLTMNNFLDFKLSHNYFDNMPFNLK